jgi:hypothetical protein
MKDRLKRTISFVVVLLSVLFIYAGITPPSPTYTSRVTPPPPAIMRNVSLVQNAKYMYPYIPSFRTSADGRVAVSVKELKNSAAVSFYSFVPEAINHQAMPFRLAPAATPPTIFPSTTVVVQILDSQLGLPSGYSPQHHTICDPTVQDLNNPPPNPNPYVCNGSDDCYTLWIISPTTNGTSLVLNSAKVVVEVANPKTAGASIRSVTVSSTINGNAIPIGNPNNPPNSNLLEPMITTDGHLLVGRIQESNLTWTNSGTQVTGKYNIVYSAGSATGFAPCDVHQWVNFYPIAHAYNDSNMNGGRYGLADYQLRDPENNLIPETADIEGNYPWIDRKGSNLFFTHVAATLCNADSSSSTGVRARYTDNCAPGINCTDPCTISGNNCPTGTQDIDSVEESDNTRGLTVAGRWTHGKMVQLDGLVNNIDYGLHVPISAQRVIPLYQSGTQPQFGSGRFNDPTGNPPDYAENITITDSFENIFNYVATLKPITLREVTWQVNMGKGGDEIPFDDYINPEAFIVSDMTASTSWAQYTYPSSNNHWSSTVVPPNANYADGFTLSPGGFNAPIHMQNSATTVSSQWNIPAYGVVTSSSGNTTGMTARVEPAALGGIKGKGFWLQDGNYVSYSINPTQPQSVINTPWFISLFVDSRCCTSGGDTTPRRILTFADESYLDIVGSSKLILGYLLNGQTTTITGALPGPLNLPTPQGWWHMAFQVAPGGQTVGVYINGFLWTTIKTQAPVFQIVPQAGCPSGGCQVTLGGDPTDQTAGFTGWVDEFKVIAQNVDYETVCNHAHGTIVGDNSPWGDVTSYPQSPNTASEGYAINQFLAAQNPSYPRLNYYGCAVSYLSDASATYTPVFGITQGSQNWPIGASLMRDYLHFPEGYNAQLVYDKPRPNSTGNQFCGSCHVDNGGQFSQTLSNGFALAAGTSQMSIDARRQPMNPQRLVYGNVPAGYFNGQQPTSGTSSSSGIPLDQWVFPDPPRNPPNP